MGYFDGQDFTLETSFPLLVPAKRSVTAPACSRNGPKALLRLGCIADRPILWGLEVRRMSEGDSQNRRAEAEMRGDTFRDASAANSMPWAVAKKCHGREASNESLRTDYITSECNIRVRCETNVKGGRMREAFQRELPGIEIRKGTTQV